MVQKLEDQPSAVVLYPPRRRQRRLYLGIGVEDGEALEDLREDLGRDAVRDGRGVPRERRSTGQHDIRVAWSREGLLVGWRSDRPGGEEPDGHEEGDEDARTGHRPTAPATRLVIDRGGRRLVITCMSAGRIIDAGR